MPIYSTKCEDCSNIEDKLLKHSDITENGSVENNSCSKCGSEHLIKLFDLEGGCFQLVGKNWFKDGY
jgi:predicted nucleic acid-binding Zn ribbon protein